MYESLPGLLRGVSLPLLLFGPSPNNAEPSCDWLWFFTRRGLVSSGPAPKMSLLPPPGGFNTLKKQRSGIRQVAGTNDSKSYELTIVGSVRDVGGDGIEGTGVIYARNVYFVGRAIVEIRSKVFPRCCFLSTISWRGCRVCARDRPLPANATPLGNVFHAVVLYISSNGQSFRRIISFARVINSIHFSFFSFYEFTLEIKST